MVDHVEAGCGVAADDAVLEVGGFLTTRVPQQAAVGAVHVEVPDESVDLVELDRVAGRVEVDLDVVHNHRAVVIHPGVVDVERGCVDRVPNIH